ncbi:trypsin-like peptidase domain-containing protein [Micromonospora sp. SL4-19]|uniref:S1C family serine protease n=1 Tax=Micromonospora sp. SL4-19 TaxID=3399129 RepID=UPI003A4D2229
MEAGYGSGDGVPGQGADEATDRGYAERAGTDRPGPLPPRLVPPSGPGHPAAPGWPDGFPAAGDGPVDPSGAAGFAAPGTAGFAAPGTARLATPSANPGAAGLPGAGLPAGSAAGAPGQAAVPGSRASWPPVPNDGRWGGPTGAAAGPRGQGWPPAQPTDAEPTVPGLVAGPPTATPAHPGLVAGPATATPAQPASGSAYPGQPQYGSAYPGQPTSGFAAAGQPAPGPAFPGQPVPGPALAAPPVSPPTHPSQPTFGAAFPGQPTSGPAIPGQPAAAPTYPGGAATGSGRRRRLPVVALALAGVLAVVAGVQAYQIYRLNDRLTATDRRLAEAQGADGHRLDGLEQRAEALEKQAGAAFNPEAVASAVLPSVFRVRAGQFTGTAFAIGKPPAEGGTTLLTNFHVVEAVYDSGGRKVFLERTSQRFEATVVKVDKDKDLAQLRTTARFTGLVAAAAPVKSGQQIVVVGAPLGLQDSVTTGVVSAFRKDEDGSGPVIQFDAPINPGNSGGPVINGSKEEVVGIATAKARDAEGIGLAVPIKTACDTFKLC